MKTDGFIDARTLQAALRPPYFQAEITSYRAQCACKILTRTDTRTSFCNIDHRYENPLYKTLFLGVYAAAHLRLKPALDGHSQGRLMLTCCSSGSCNWSCPISTKINLVCSQGHCSRGVVQELCHQTWRAPKSRTKFTGVYMTPHKHYQSQSANRKPVYQC